MPKEKNPTALRVEEIAERIGQESGLEIVEVDVVGGGKARLVRIYIDKPGGVTHADCELISHRVGEVLDTEDVVPGESYTLEVSSPGVERKLSKPRDFERFTGEKVKVALRDPIDGQRRFEGRLASFSGDVVTLELPNGKELQFSLSQLDKANLKYEW